MDASPAENGEKTEGNLQLTDISEVLRLLLMTFLRGSIGLFGTQLGERILL